MFIEKKKHGEALEILKQIIENIKRMMYYMNNDFTITKGTFDVKNEEEMKIQTEVKIIVNECENEIAGKGKQEENDLNEHKENSNNIKSNKKCDKFEAMIEDVIIKDTKVTYDDIIGMKDLKETIDEIIVLPSIRPDLFQGLREPQRGLLLFGPPGTGKTMIAKAIASECKRTFFNISASCFTSKWFGNSEKIIRALFQLAYKRSSAIIFIDEIESILSRRTENKHEVTKRLKTGFLIQFDGLATNLDSKLLVVAAPNRPADLDEALLRRLPKRVYCSP